MLDYADFPPYPYFLQVLRHYPDCAIFYSRLWNSKNNDHKLSVKKDDIFNTFLISPTKFKNMLVNLMEEGLLSFELTPKFFYIELVGFDHDDFDEE